MTEPPLRLVGGRRGRRRGVPDAEERRSELVGRVQRGDEAAFAALYDELAPIVFGVVRKVVRDRAQSEEVTQEVFVQLWRQAPRFDPAEGAVTTWAVTVAHRRAVDRVRSEQRERDRVEHESRLQARRVDEQPEAAAELRLEAERVRRALDGLTPVQRQAIELAYYGGLSQAEISSLLDLPLGTTKTRVRDGLIRLRDALGVG